MKYLRLCALVAAHHCFQMVQAFFSACLFEGFQENARQVTHRVCHPRVELTSPHVIDRFTEERSYFMCVSKGIVRRFLGKYGRRLTS